MEPPPLAPRWFRATDVPKRDATPFKFRPPTQTPKTPQQWAPFSLSDSAAIEEIYQRLLRESQTTAAARPSVSPVRSTVREQTPRRPENCIVGGEDKLYEIDVENKEISPIYWDGATFDIRRGTWFSLQSTGYQPCDENLSRQIEDGYRKYTPWMPAGFLIMTSVATSLSSSEDVAIPATKHETQRWALFGPYMNQYVAYATPTTAWLQSDMFASKLTRAVTNSSGVRLVRGWDEVCKITQKTRTPAKRSEAKADSTADAKADAKVDAKADAEAAAPPASDGNPANAPPPAGNSQKPPANAPGAAPAASAVLEEDDLGADRQVDHLIFVIHGIGQKLSEQIEAVNFPEDCNVLRKAIKDAARQVHDRTAYSKPQDAAKIPVGSGVQVLPIQWREKIDFGMRAREKQASEDDEELNFDDIVLEGIPSIRMLVSDVILDVLLYLTPKYRQEMLRQVSAELNRVYKEYMTRNPGFTGKVSIYGHSLGSLLAYDIVSHQHLVRDAGAAAKPKTANREVDISDLLAMTMREGRVSGLIERVDDLDYTPLDFKVNALFAVGSPVGLFLMLRGNRIRKFISHEVSSADMRLSRPEVTSLYNIFHPFDPVAHRIEPLVMKSFASLKPVAIPYTKGGLTKTLVGIQDLGSDIVERGRSIFETMRYGLFTSISTTAEIVGQAGRAINLGFAPTNAVEGPPQSSARQLPQQLQPPSEDGRASTAMPSASADDAQRAADTAAKAARAIENNDDIHSLNPNGRIDFALQEGILENPYLSSLGSHMSYWADADCAMFILKELYHIPLVPIARRNSFDGA
ncbi:hypothetical protein HK105_208653 [Polyrhizophydium stewartii]|uniref:DDHD domain-containing protein n=1 Tax=Polyrhizophydium stewartii TaxID=2732419 RepID=A0ABR4MX71_9FUNG